MSFRIASKEAVKSAHTQHKVGAVIAKSGRILSTGFNSLRPSSKLRTPTLHAEAAAVLKLLNQRRLSDLAGAEIYVTRFTKGGRVGLARPCPNCYQLIRACGISQIHYTTNDGTTISERV